MKRSSIIIAAVGVLAAQAALAGGIRLSIQFPEQPCDVKKGETALVVNTTECGTPKDLKLEGRAEGFVGGKRVSLPLKLKKGASPGLYEVKPEWPREGEWVLVFTATAWGHHGTLLVGLGENGGFHPVSGNTSQGHFKAVRMEQVNGKAKREQVEGMLTAAPRVAGSETQKAS